MKKLLALLLLFGIVSCSSVPVMEVSQRDSTPISFAKIVPDYEEMTPYKAQARNLKTGEIFSVGNFPTSVGATSNAISGCELLFKSQCILVKNNDITIEE
tara:strand:- start:42 stop:341 length:300 start_codon:yes stop_codon:yes gene_type:complete